jgi:trimeric autotransporter adhesin
MSNYTQTYDFSAKDSLASGDTNKIIRGSEFDTEFAAISAAIATKANTASPTLTGTPLAPTAANGTSNTQIATCEFVANAISAGTAGVASIAAATGGGLTFSSSTGAVSASADNTIVGFLGGSQTFSGAKTFTGGIESTSYDFDNTGSNIEVASGRIDINYQGTNIARFVESGDQYIIGLNGSNTRGLLYDAGDTSIGVGFLSGNGVVFVGSATSGTATFSSSNVYKPTGTTFLNPSDQRLKENITNYTKGLAAVNMLRPVNFTFKGELGVQTNNKNCVGFIAQDVAATDLSTMVSTGADGYYRLDVSELTFTLVNAVKELSAKVTALEAEVTALKAGA